jgi:hypothetical protein
MSETLSIEKLPPLDRGRFSQANTAADLQVTTALMHRRQLHARPTGKPKSHTMYNVDTLLAFIANAAGGGIVGGLYNAPLNVTRLAAASLTVGAPVLGQPTATLPSGVVENFKESREPSERVSAASSFRGRVTGPVRSLLALFDRWQISDASAAILLGTPAASFVSDLRSGISTLNSRDLKDRARLIIGIYEGVHSLMQESDAERLWIKSPVPGLNSQSPFDVMMRGSISDLLRVKQFVDYANGR